MEGVYDARVDAMKHGKFQPEEKVKASCYKGISFCDKLLDSVVGCWCGGTNNEFLARIDTFPWDPERMWKG